MNASAGAGWLELMVGYLIKSSLLLALALVLAFLLRKRSAGLRHLVLSLFLLGLLFLPVLSALTSGWETDLLPSWRTGIAGHMESGGWLPPRAGSTGSRIDSPAAGDVRGSGKEGKTSDPHLVGLLPRMKPTLGPAVLGAWLMGAALLLFRLALGLRGAVRLTREGRAARESIWRRLLRRFLSVVSLRRKVHLLSHDRIRVPLTWGILRPVVMMPSGSDSWSEGQRSSALYHELAHVKRGDFLVMLLARLSRALYWFNPLSWVVFRLLRREQEKACDELVLKAGIKPSTYAENLLLIRNSVPARWNPPAAVLGALGRSHLNDRLVAILSQKLNFEEVKMKTKLMLGILVILSVSFLGMARPSGLKAGVEYAFVTDNTVMTAPATFPDVAVFPHDQEKEQQEKQEKKKEEEKAKEEHDKTTLVLTAEEGESKTITITIHDKGEKKTIELKAPYVLTIQEKPDKTIVLHSPHLVLKKGEEGTWTLKRGKPLTPGHLKTIQLKKGTILHLKEHGGETGKAVEFVVPAIKLKEAVPIPKDINVHIVTKEGDTRKVVVAPHVEVHPDVDVHADVAVTVTREVYRKQIEEIRASIKKLKEQDLDASEKEKELQRIEEALAKLNEEMEQRHAHGYSYAYKVHTEPLHFEVIRRGEGEEKKDIYVVGESGGHVLGVVDDEGTYTAYIQNESGDVGQVEYDQLIRGLKERLSEDYEIEGEFDAQEDRFTIKIKSQESMDITADMFKTMVKILKEELEKIKK